MGVKTWIFGSVMIAGFIFAFYTLTPVYYNIRSSMNSTATDIVTDPTALTHISNVVSVFGHLWAWVAALGAGFIILWMYIHSTKKDYESIQNP